MMWRVYFIFGDLVACCLTGAASAWFVQTVVPADWAAVFGMAIGMVLGGIAGIIGGFAFTPLFGAMEVMLPVSLSAMTAGMGAGMAQTMTDNPAGISWSDALLGGVSIGLACLIFTYILQAITNGNAPVRKVK